jgi:predicted flap endonuclease-1-like 5' DNA nuclease
MPILRKLKSLLGAGDADEQSERDVTVTVEHDPENEAAIKGADIEDTEAESGAAADEGLDADEEPDDEPADADADEPVEIPDAEGGTADAESAVDADGEAGETEDGEVWEADTGSADDAGSDEPVDVLNGIGPAYAERLENAGIETVGDLAAADATTLADDADIAEGRIQGWIDQASEY